MSTDQATLTMRIEGMSCGHCVRGVTQALASVGGVEVEQVAVGSATVRYAPGSVGADTIVRAVEAEGYTVSSAR